MRNTVELVLDEERWEPAYKIELYISMEEIQDMKAYGMKDEIPKVVGIIVMNEIDKFNKNFQEGLKNRFSDKIRSMLNYKSVG